MADINRVNQINFDYNGKHYCLEYTPESIKQLESAGFTLNDIQDKPATRIEQLWAGAFLANHRRVSNTIQKEIYKSMKDREKLVHALTEMYMNTLNYLMPDEEESGNVEWTATL